MSTRAPYRSQAPTAILERHPLAAYWVITFAISWAGALVVAAPGLIRGTGISNTTGMLMFPAMLLGPLASGILMSRVTGGREGTRDLVRRMRRWRVGLGWYAVLLSPPAMVLLTLFLLQALVSRSFAPNHFWIGIAFGVPAGICEEIGWTGFAFPQMRARRSALGAAVLLGVLWGIWHLPVINFLGAAIPHRQYWFAFFLAFTFAMAAMRVLIAWIYSGTNSVLLPQLMHISSTGALVIFSPPVSAAREAMWYALYGCLLWLMVGIVVAARGRQLGSG
jgi:membrane protease YdiL (CAAX protease family)